MIQLIFIKYQESIMSIKREEMHLNVLIYGTGRNLRPVHFFLNCLIGKTAVLFLRSIWNCVIGKSFEFTRQYCFANNL